MSVIITGSVLHFLIDSFQVKYGEKQGAKFSIPTAKWNYDPGNNL